MIHGSGRIKRLIAGGVLGLSALAFAPNTASADVATFCANVPTGQSGFTDIAQAGVHARNVECAKGAGLTAGKTATTYAPTENVSRAQMASFIANMVDKANQLDSTADTRDIQPLPSNPPDAFTDDENTGGHENNINRLAAADIIQGQTATTYNPTANVSRAQMATFIAEALEFIRGAALTEGADRFTDDETSIHEANINRLANAGIVVGETATTYGPGNPISRAQMASFLVQAMADLFDDGFITAIPAAAGQADFSANPAGEQVIQLSPTGGGGARDIVFNLGQAGRTIDGALFHCGDGDDPAVRGTTFRDEEGASAGKPDFLADDNGETYNGNAFIVSTDGDPQGGSQFDNYTVQGSTVTVRVNSTNADCAFVVVWVDTDDDDRLDLASETFTSTADRAYRTPSEDFGVAGPVVWHFGEAEFGNNIEQSVIYHNEAQRFWVDTDGDLFRYGRSNDRYFLDCFGDPAEINLAQWTEFLTPDDNTSDDVASYNPDGPNSFENEGDVPFAPFGFTSAVGDFDATADTASDDVRFTIDRTDPGADIDTYTVRRYNATTGAFIDSVTSAAESNIVTFTELAPASYLFRALATSECGSTSDLTDPALVTVSAPPPGPVAGAPLSTTAAAQDKDSSATLNTGDVLTITFNEVMAAPNAGDSIQVTDSDGTVASITNGLNATFALGTSNNQLVITMTAGPSITTTGTIIGVQYPASATGSSGVTDADENLEWNIAGSPDTTF